MKNSHKREVDLVVISDTHLGTIAANTKELLMYLNSINPKTLVINGDFVDIWQFNKKYWDKHHTKVIKKILTFISKGVNVHYVVGNHDESFRRFLGFNLSGLSITNKLILNLNGKKAWFFHGDVFDVTMQYSRWLTRLGGYSYDLLIFVNSIVNRTLNLFGMEKKSFSKAIKNKVKGAVAYVNKFEETVAKTAIRNGYDYAVCGHIHQPCIKEFNYDQKTTFYLNSGDWVENLTALEYNESTWSLYQFNVKEFLKNQNKDEEEFKSAKTLYTELVDDFKLL